MKKGLVLEGGALRGIFTSGVVDYFLLENIEFDYAVGVSAGAGNITSFKSKQTGRTANVMAGAFDRSSFGIMELIHSKKFVNLDKLLDINGNNPLDFDTYFKNPLEVEYTVCCCESGEAEYMSEDSDEERVIDIVRASCSMPMLCAPVKIGSKHYLDGSIGNSIPLDRAIEKGCDKAIVVLTKPEGVGPEDYSKYKRILRRLYGAYPEFIKSACERISRYNEKYEYLKQLEAQGRALIIRPHSSVSKLEKDKDVLRGFYRQGYNAAKTREKEIKAFLEIT